MPLPPVNPPSGFSTSLLQNNQFYPSYHSYLGFKELNKQVFPLLEFIDWFGNQETIEVSLYRYLNDKKADFTSVDLTKFKVMK